MVCSNGGQTGMLGTVKQLADVTRGGGVGSRGPRDWDDGGAGRGAGRRRSRKTKWKGPATLARLVARAFSVYFGISSDMIRVVRIWIGNSCIKATWLSSCCSPTKGTDASFGTGLLGSVAPRKPVE